MGTASTVIYTKRAVTLTVAHLVDNGNAIFDAVEASGMLRVPHEVATGQCDQLVTAATENPFDVVVTLEYGTWPSSSNRAVKGFKIFRHPDLGFYLRIAVLEMGSTGSNTTTLGLEVQYASELTAEGTLENPLTFYPRAGSAFGWVPNENNYITGKELTLRVSTGRDHFVFGHTFDMGTYDYARAIGSGVDWSGQCMNPRGGYSTLAFTVVQTSDPKYNVIMVPRNMSSNSSYPMELTMGSFSPSDTGLQRKWLVDTTTGATTYLGAGPSVTGMPEPGTVSDKYGIRVAQLTMTVNGEQLSLPLGTVHGGAVEDMGLLIFDLDGNGPRQFFCSYGFGPTTFVSCRHQIANTPYMLFPYGD